MTKLLGLSLFLSVSLAQAAETLPLGNCADAGLFTQLEHWCEQNRTLPGPKAYYCVQNDRTVSVEDHNASFSQRVSGVPSRRNIRIACAQICGPDPFLARTIGYYSPEDPTVETTAVDSLIYCHCPNAVSGSLTPPPTQQSYRAKLLKYKDWQAMSDFDRACSGAKPGKIEAHNRKLKGVACSKEPHRRLACANGLVDRCSRYSSHAQMGAEPWIHQCLPY